MKECAVCRECVNSMHSLANHCAEKMYGRLTEEMSREHNTTGDWDKYRHSGSRALLQRLSWEQTVRMQSFSQAQYTTLLDLRLTVCAQCVPETSTVETLHQSSLIENRVSERSCPACVWTSSLHARLSRLAQSPRVSLSAPSVLRSCRMRVTAMPGPPSSEHSGKVSAARFVFVSRYLHIHGSNYVHGVYVTCVQVHLVLN